MTPSQIKRLKALEPKPREVEPAGAAMENVRRQLDQMAARRRAQPGWKEPSAAERAAIMVRVSDAAVRHSVPAG
jgi:hypothetical protein